MAQTLCGAAVRTATRGWTYQTAASTRSSTIMAQPSIPRDTLKQAMKEALAETLSEQRDLFREVFAEVLEDLALIEAMEEGRQTEKVDRAEVFAVLEGRS